MKIPEEQPEINLVKVRLKRPHTHAGMHYDAEAVAAGVDIEITEKQALVLKDQGVI